MNLFMKTICAAAVASFFSAAMINNVQACMTYEEYLAIKKSAECCKDEKPSADGKVGGTEKPADKETPQLKGDTPPKIQLAILLDTSGSMSGLIDQARTQIWKIVNEFAFVTQKGVTPEFEVSLYEYGNSGLQDSEGYLRQIVGFSTDLDKISEELFKLSTNGGSEHCGQVIKSAVEGLKWSEHETDYKAIFIAGNEPFTQGPVEFKDACKAAITKGIIVNTIHCGSHQEGIDGKWLEGAQLADGSYMSIDHNTKVAHVEAPQDNEIIELGKKLNDTYIHYGKEGEEGAKRQEAQDSNANDAGQGADVNRALAKKNSQYRNAAWDLIDAIDEKKVKLEDIKAEDLPEALRKLSKEELAKYIDEKRKERAEIKEKLNKLEADRNKFVVAKRLELAESGEESLDAAMIKAIREQAGKRGFKNEG